MERASLRCALSPATYLPFWSSEAWGNVRCIHRSYHHDEDEGNEMTWVKLDDGFHSHPKVLLVGDAGAGLFARALSYCSANLTDGWVPKGFTARKQMADKLSEAGLWVPVEKGQTFSYDMRGGRTYTVIVPGCGWFIPDYLMLNPDAESERERRRVRHEAKVEAGKIGAARRWQKA